MLKTDVTGNFTISDPRISNGIMLGLDCEHCCHTNIRSANEINGVNCKNKRSKIVIHFLPVDTYVLTNMNVRLLT